MGRTLLDFIRSSAFAKQPVIQITVLVDHAGLGKAGMCLAASVFTEGLLHIGVGSKIDDALGDLPRLWLGNHQSSLLIFEQFRGWRRCRRNNGQAGSHGCDNGQRIDRITRRYKRDISHGQKLLKRNRSAQTPFGDEGAVGISNAVNEALDLIHRRSTSPDHQTVGWLNHAQNGSCPDRQFMPSGRCAFASGQQHDLVIGKSQFAPQFAIRLPGNAIQVDARVDQVTASLRNVRSDSQPMQRRSRADHLHRPIYRSRPRQADHRVRLIGRRCHDHPRRPTGEGSHQRGPIPGMDQIPPIRPQRAEASQQTGIVTAVADSPHLGGEWIAKAISQLPGDLAGIKPGCDRLKETESIHRGDRVAFRRRWTIVRKLRSNGYPATVNLFQEACRQMTMDFQNGMDSWRIFRIMAEFVEGFEMMAPVGPAVSIFGSARIPPQAKYYKECEETARLLSKAGFAIITGGGPGIMEAGNKGAYEAGGQSIGLNITLPQEQEANKYQTLSLDFHYFYARKVMFTKYACAFVCFPGGYGTLDELLETLTLVQTLKIDPIPVVLYGSEYWTGLIEWMRKTLAPKYIDHEDLDIFRLVDTPRDVLKCVKQGVKKPWWNPADRELKQVTPEPGTRTPPLVQNGSGDGSGEGTRYGRRPQRTKKRHAKPSKKPQQ